MKRIAIAVAAVAALLGQTQGIAPRVSAAAPPAGALSPQSPTMSWAGRTWATPNPLTCFSAGGIDPTCDRFALTIVPPKKNFAVTIRVTAANATDQAPPTDDIDLYVRDPNGNTI